MVGIFLRQLDKVDHQGGQKGLTGALVGLSQSAGSFREMDASFCRTFTEASRPSTSLTAHSTRRTALVTAAQTMSSPSGA